MSQHPGRFTTANRPGVYGRKVRGPPPSMVPTACTACGKVRWLHPVSIAASSGLCIKCARRKQRKKLMPRKINHVSLRERLQIAQFLDAHTEPNGKYVKYVNGVTNDVDAAKLLTDAMGRMVTVDNVRATRLSVCGKLRNPGKSLEELNAMRAKRGRKPKNNDAVLDAIAELRREVRELRQSLERTGDVPMDRANGPLITTTY